MSGPKTTSYRFTIEWRQELARRQAEERRSREEHAKRVAAALAQCDQLEKRAQRLRTSLQELKERFPSEIVDVVLRDFSRPVSDDPVALEGYAREMGQELDRVSSAVQAAEQQAQANIDFRQAAGAVAEMVAGNILTAEAVIDRFLETKRLLVSTETLDRRKMTVQRVLGRLSTEGWGDVPASLELLALEAVSADSDQRADALISELRLVVQKLNQERAERQHQQREARALLDRLEQEIPFGEDRLKQRLELVIAGAAPLMAEVAAQVTRAIESAAGQTRQSEIQLAASKIIQESLTDLGYQVGPIENTLFVKGGTAYFKKAGWEDYCVRLAVRPNESKMNFNVVRVAVRGDEQAALDRSTDIQIENDWCSEFPRLMNTLQARGIEPELVRQLAAGEVPVPVVDEGDIPAALLPEKAPKIRKQPFAGKVNPGED